LLGGHGRDYKTFKKSKWEDWQKPIIDEYERLNSMGYTNISLVGSSTAAPLIIEMIYSGKISKFVQPKHLMFIDPMIIASNKTLSLVDYVGFAIGYIKSQLDNGEQGHWYQYRPQESLKELLEIIDKVRSKLEGGIVLPQSTTLKVYKSINDASADPVGAVILYNGIKKSNGGKIDIEVEKSNLHVFTRLHGRNSYSSGDKERQINAFRDFQKILGQ